MSSSDQVRTYSRAESVVFLKTDEPFGGLSNMAGGFPIRVNGIRFLTSEALYQACRFPHLPEVQRMIIGENSPMTAKMRSKPYRKDSRPEWDHVRVRIMRWCLRMKLANNWSTFSDLLLRSGTRPIVEQSRKDDFWGAKAVGDGSTLVGMNVLGRLLMELREQAKANGRAAFQRVETPGVPDFQLLGRPIEAWSLTSTQQGAAGARTPQTALFGDDLPMDQPEARTPAPATSTQETGQQPRMPVPLQVEVDVGLAAQARPAGVRNGAGAYPSYRTARMRWLPPVPEHWNEQRAKTYFREVDERSRTGQEELLSVSHLTGVTPRSQKNVTMFKAASYVGAKLCRPGDIVINTLWAWMAALGASKHTGIVSPAYGVYRPHTPASFNPAYLDYLLRTHAYVAEYIGRSTGIRASRLRLYPSQFLDIPLIQPACDEQDQIVSYLRVQDANIGQFVRAKRAQITLLIEQKLRIIDEAVAQGVDSTVGFKSSGIDWIGKIPEHWSVVRLRNLVESITSGSRGWSDYASDEGPLFLRVGNLSRGALNLKLKKTVRLQLPEETRVEGTRTRVREGDILLSITAFIGSVGLVPADLGEAYVSQHVARCRLRKGAANPKWVAFVLLSRIGQAHGSICMYGGTKQGLSLSDVKNYVVVLPPRQEQDDLVAQIEAQIAVLDRAIEAGRNEIDRVREYHDRLVWDAVTGQIDLRTWQPGPDDFVTEEDLAALGDDDENETTEETDGDD